MNEKVDKGKLKDKSLGCLIGGAVGDSLGYPIEFTQYSEVLKKYGELGITEYQKDNGVALFQMIPR